MAIECYYSGCFFHSNNKDPYEEGPFCDEKECQATEEQLILFEKYRQKNADKDLKRPTSTE